MWGNQYSLRHSTSAAVQLAVQRARESRTCSRQRPGADRSEKWVPPLYVDVTPHSILNLSKMECFIGRLFLLVLAYAWVRLTASQVTVTGPSDLVSPAPTGMVFASAVRNLTVSTRVFQKESRTLQLHVSWQLPTEGRRPTRLILHVVPINYTGCPQEPNYCPDGFIYEVIEDKKTSSISVPKSPRDPHLRIVPDCCYEVKVESSPHNGKTFAAKNFTVPECTEDVCSCRQNRLPAPNITAVQHLGKGSIKVNWIVETTEGVTQFVVRLGEESGIRSKADLMVFNTSLQQMVEARGRSRHHVAVLEVALKPGRDYKLDVVALDRRQCRSQQAELIFHGGSLMETLKNGTNNKNISVVPMVVASCVLAAILCLLIAVLTRRRWLTCLSSKLGWVALRPPDTYKPVMVASDTTRFSDLIKSVLHERNILYVDAEIEDARQRGDADDYEIKEERLHYIKEVGKGAFGRVFMARVEALAGVPGPIIVAVKKLLPQASDDEAEQFLAEIAMMKKAGRHRNVVAMLGCCTLTQPYCMVMEYVPCGDLLHYLYALRAQYQCRVVVAPKYLDLMLSSSDSGGSYIFPAAKTDPSATASAMSSSAKTNSHSSVLKSEWSIDSGSPDPTVELPIHGRSHIDCVLDSKELQNFALQVARGMAYLEQLQITHRDLAARNVLIDQDKTLKISDFGLSRSGVYVNMRHKKVPLRWLSIEAIQDSLYSNKSDVWAFAVLLWEIGTLGAIPYPTVGDYRLLPYLLEGKRLEKPDICTNQLYTLMLRCWSQSTAERPSFAELVPTLEDMTSSRPVYVDFGALQPGHAFPPTEHELKST